MVARLVLRRREVVCCRVYSAAVVEDFDVIKDFISRLLPRLEAFVVDEFIFQDAEKALRHRVIPTVTLKLFP